MNPGVFVLGGGGDGGGSGAGRGKGAAGKQGAGGSNGGKDAQGGGKQAPDPKKYPKCGSKSHPVDVVTGRAYTHELIDFALPGPMPLVLERSCSSTAAGVNVGLGWGWSHTLGWRLEVHRRKVRVRTDRGTYLDLPLPRPGHEAMGPWGWIVRRSAAGAFSLDVGQHGVWRHFEPSVHDGSEQRLSSIEDANHNRVTLRYSEGRLVEITDSAGRTIRAETAPNGNITRFLVRNAIERGQWITLIQYDYDERGCLIAATDADGHTARYEYDDDHRLTRDTDRNGLSFHFRYGEDGRCVEAWGDYPGGQDPSLAADVPATLADGRTPAKGVHHCLFLYGPDGYSEIVDSTQISRFFGNERGTIDRWCEGPGALAFGYDERGFLIRVEEPSGAVTSYGRDERGRLTFSMDALGRRTEIERDASGLPVKIVDPAGGVTEIVRDAAGNPTSARNAAGSIIGRAYDARGLVTAMRFADGSEARFEYDAHGNPTLAVQPNGGAWRFVHDALGRRLSATDPLGVTTRFAYSNRGDLIAVYDGAGGTTRYAYDGEQQLREVVDPAGRVTEYTWGGYRRLCARKDSGGGVARLEYNREGELVRVVDERGHAHTFERDTFGRVVAETTFDGRTTRYSLDEAGRRVRIKAGDGEVTLLEWNAVDEVVARKLPDGVEERFTYDERGDLIGAVSGQVEITIERDPVGRIVAETQVVDGRSVRVQVAHDAAGRRVRRSTSLGHAEEIVRDASGARVRTVLDGSHVTAFENDAFAREVRRLLPGGGVMESTYDALGRVVARRVQTGAALHDVPAGQPGWVGARREGVTVDARYQFDPAGELVAAWDADRGATTYRHDPIGQLAAVVPDKARETLFRYDAARNRREDGAVCEHGPGGRLLRRGNTALDWDASGQLRRKRVATPEGEVVTTYTWNGLGLLDRVDLPDGRVVTFLYDSMGRRLQKRVAVQRPSGERVPVSSTRFVWDGHVLVHEIREQAAAEGDPIVEERTFSFDEDTFVPLAHRDGRDGEWFQYVTDVAGRPEVLVDARGEVAAVCGLDAWGKRTAKTAGRTSTPLRLAGQYEDEETGLHYNRWRYYDPDLGQYVSPDRTGLRGGLRPYGYGLNPLVYVDPLGLSKVKVPPDPSGKPANLTIEPGSYSQSEIDAAIMMANRDCSKPVQLRQPTGQRQINGATSDLVVDGKTYDVYTPETKNPDRIVGGIFKKNDQASGVVVDLRNNSTKSGALGDVPSRLQGKANAENKQLNIDDVVFMD